MCIKSCVIWYLIVGIYPIVEPQFVNSNIYTDRQSMRRWEITVQTYAVKIKLTSCS